MCTFKSKYTLETLEDALKGGHGASARTLKHRSLWRNRASMLRPQHGGGSSTKLGPFKFR